MFLSDKLLPTPSMPHHGLIAWIHRSHHAVLPVPATGRKPLVVAPAWGRELS